MSLLFLAIAPFSGRLLFTNKKKQHVVDEKTFICDRLLAALAMNQKHTCYKISPRVCLHLRKMIIIINIKGGTKTFDASLI